MFILYFALWIVFNGAFTIEIALFGLGVSALIYAFSCKFMGFSIHKDIVLCKRVFLFIGYIFILIWEIIKANIEIMKYIVVKQEDELHPVVFAVKTNLKSNVCRVLLANSITLTPGTITIEIVEDTLYIHAVDESMVISDIQEFVFEKYLLKMEGDNK